MADPDKRRDPPALAAAINARWRIYRFRAYVVGAIVGLLLGAVPAAVVTSTLLALLAAWGFSLDPALPWEEVTWGIAFLVVFAASGAWAVVRLLPGRFKAALESYVWLAMRAEAHWASVFDRPVPRTAPAMRAFLDAVPVTTATANEIATIWLALGDLDTTRRVVGSMPEVSNEERHQRLAVEWLIDFVAGTDRPLEPLEASAATIEDAEARLEAQVEIAVDVARVALVGNGDWIGPMAAIRPRLSGEPSTALWRFAFGPEFRTMLLFGGIGVAAFWFFSLIA